MDVAHVLENQLAWHPNASLKRKKATKRTKWEPKKHTKTIVFRFGIKKLEKRICLKTIKKKTIKIVNFS